MLHSLLLRILKRCGLPADPAAADPPDPEQWREFLEQVSRVLVEADQHRELMERSLALSSEEMRANAEQLRHARDEAQAANLAKSAFLANMSHEIRTPMTAILGFADLLLNPAILPEQVHDYVQTIRRNGEHLLEIINDILDVSKVEAGRMKVERLPALPVQIARDVIQCLSARASKKGLALELTCRTALPRTLHTDPTRLRQILMNLVGNAIKFTERGGVRVALSTQQIQSGHVLQIEVIDSGIGVTPEQIARLFQPFVQADATTTRRFGGTGLGLTISKQLAQLLGGDIRVTSTPNVGSTFIIELPVDPKDASDLIDPITAAAAHTSPSAHIQTNPASNAGLLGGVRVLLAEDGPDNQRLIRFHLEKAGASVEIAPDGVTACDSARTARHRGQPFHIILMDMQMPEMDGYAATAHLRSEGYELPIIALTAHAMAGDREKCLAAGCDEFAVKPVDRERLLSLCAEFAQRANMLMAGDVLTGAAAETARALR